ncbi:hypothetical protein NX059_011546 [Plenodomus lindquistii]|nr:hypothetical protein NX059_011546 [Plenodomus lindquistii]
MENSRDAPSRLATSVSQNTAIASHETGSHTQDSHDVFRFLDLPAELRIQIYKYVLPHSLIISFHEDTNHEKRLFWTTKARKQSNRGGAYELGGPRMYRGKAGIGGLWTFFPHGISGTSLHLRPLPTSAVAPIYDEEKFHNGWLNRKYIKPRDETPLYYINKVMGKETQAILYGANIFRFSIDDAAHEPVSFQSPKIFGALGVKGRLHLLRNLRTIHIKITFEKACRWTVKRLRARLEYFVEVLKQYADDDNKRSLLTDLVIKVKLVPYPGSFDVLLEPADMQSFKSPGHALFSLESLAALRGIKNVKVTGVPDWYAECLQKCIQGKGGEPEELDWPLVETRNRNKNGKWQKQWVTTRQWYHPTLDWQAFAERNGIKAPADVDYFWMAKS